MMQIYDKYESIYLHIYFILSHIPFHDGAMLKIFGRGCAALSGSRFRLHLYSFDIGPYFEIESIFLSMYILKIGNACRPWALFTFEVFREWCFQANNATFDNTFIYLYADYIDTRL